MTHFLDRPFTWWVAFAFAALLLVAPLTVVDMPPLLDYPNHLARMLILAAGDADPILSRFWAPAWGLLPNLATDLVIPPLSHIMPINVAGRLALGAILLLQFAGVVVYHRAAFGKRSWWSLGAALVACNAVFLLGFMNFVAGLGPALLVAALWIAARETRPVLAIAGAMLGLLALFFCHIAAVLFCAVLIGAQEIAMLVAYWRRGGSSISAALRRVAALVLALGPTAALYAASALSQTEGPSCWVTPSRKAINLLVPFMNYYGALDLLTALTVLCVLVSGLWAQGGRAHPGTVLAACILFAMYLAAPFEAKGGAFVDTRFPVMLGLLLFAGFRPQVPSAIGPAVAFALAALFVLRTGLVVHTWTEHAQDLTQIRASIAAIEPGSRVLVVSAEKAAAPDYWRHSPRSRVIARFMTVHSHLGALVTLERRAFIPLLFAVRSQQPLQVKPPYDRLAAAVSAPPDYRLLARERWLQDELEFAPYLPLWQDNFEYVLLLLADAVPDVQTFLPEQLEVVNRTGFTALFRVHPPTMRAVANQLPPLPRQARPCGFN
jgi:hypothetical protein